MKEPTTEKQRYWSKMVTEANSSGLSLVDFARTKDLPVQKLYQWRSTLQETSSKSAASNPHFTQVVAPPLSGSLTVELNGARLRFDRLPDVQWLSRLIHFPDNAS